MTLKPEVLAAMDRGDRLFSSTHDAAMSNQDWQTIRAELLAMDARLSGNADLYTQVSPSVNVVTGYVVLVDGTVLKTIHPTLEAARERALQCYTDKHLVSIATIGETISAE